MTDSTNATDPDELGDTLARIARAAGAARASITRRDDLIRHAAGLGASWAAIGRAAQMTPVGARKAAQRTAAAEQEAPTTGSAQ